MQPVVPPYRKSRRLASADDDGDDGDCRHHNGVPLLPADNARVPGWQRVREALAKQPDGAPELFIFETCRNLIRTLPQLTFDTRDAEDVSDACEDHAPEALRYGLMSRPRPAPEEKRKRPYRYDPLAGTPQFSPGFYGL